jgi:hypothetical protein
LTLAAWSCFAEEAIELARPEVHNAFPNLWNQRTLSEVPLHPLSRRASLTLGLTTEAASTKRPQS